MSGWYGQTSYPDLQGINGKYTIAQIGCLLTSFCNLLRKFGRDVDPASLNRLFAERGIWIDIDDGIRDELGWASVTAYDGSVHVSQVGGAAWPGTNNAIVKFHYQSRYRPWLTGANGVKIPNMLDHFCLVADEVEHTIIDSWDGQIKTSPYGEPVAFATYEALGPMPVQPVPMPRTRQTPAPSSKTHKVIAGETLIGIAVANHTTWQVIRELNNLADPNKINAGQIIYLPETEAVAEVSSITYEVLPNPIPMHVSKPGGAEKWSFGNLKTYKDAASTGHYGENSNTDIVAVAKVPVGGEVAAYCMDRAALGDYTSTGLVAYTIGFNHADLSEGYYEAPKEQAPPTPIATDEYTVVKGDDLWWIASRYLGTGNAIRVKAKVDEIVGLNGITDPNLIFPGQRLILKAPEPAPVPVPEPAPAAPAPQVEAVNVEAKSTSPIKAAFVAFPAPTSYRAVADVVAEELDERQKGKKLLATGWVTIDGTFIVKDSEGRDVLMGRSKLVHDQPGAYWYGVPMSNMQSEAEIFNVNSYAPQPVKARGLPLYEKIWDIANAIWSKFKKGKV